jgi:AraC family transcriptional regulator
MDKREHIAAAGKVQDFIENNLNCRITFRKTGEVCGYSPWHCIRVFRSVTGMNPNEYIKARRLCEAAKILKEENRKVVDVAFDFMFDSHEGFTRAFSKEFGISPVKARNNKQELKLFMPGRVRDYYLKRQRGENSMDHEKTDSIFVQVVERPERKLILKRGVRATHYFEYCEEAGCDVWNIISGIREAIFEPAGFWLPEKMVKKGTSVYVQGVEVPADYTGVVPAGFEIVDMPACRMMVFQSEPYNDEDFEKEIDKVWEKIRIFKPGIYGYEWADEEAPRIQLEPLGYRGYIEARPVRAVRE